MITLMFKLMFWMMKISFILAGYMIIGVFYVSVIGVQLLWWCIKALYALVTRNRIPSMHISNSSDYFGKISSFGKGKSINIDRSSSTRNFSNINVSNAVLDDIGCKYEAIFNDLAREDDVVLAHFTYLNGSLGDSRNTFKYRYMTDDEILREELNIMQEMLSIMDTSTHFKFNLINSKTVEAIIEI